MLREEVWEMAWFLLNGRNQCRMLTIVGRSIQQLDISPTMCRLSGISELVPLRSASRISSCRAHVRYPLGQVCELRGGRCASLTRSR